MGHENKDSLQVRVYFLSGNSIHTNHYWKPNSNKEFCDNNIIVPITVIITRGMNSEWQEVQFLHPNMGKMCFYPHSV